MDEHEYLKHFTMKGLEKYKWDFLECLDCGAIVKWEDSSDTGTLKKHYEWHQLARV